MPEDTAKHTPEWRMEHQKPEQMVDLDRDFYPYLITSDVGECVARVRTREWATMCAAGPELLEARKAIVKAPGSDHLPGDIANLLMDAIAKATIEG